MAEITKEQDQELDKFLSVNVKDIKEIIHKQIEISVNHSMSKYKDMINEKLDKFFGSQKSIFSSRGDDESPFETNLAWAFELSIRGGVEAGVEEFGLKEKVKQETIKLLQDKEFLELIAKKQIARSMGIDLN